MTLDHKKLAVIHIVKRELGLSDEEYRDILQQLTGRRSARELTEAGFRRLMHAFARSHHYQPQGLGITLRQKLYIKHLVADLKWDPDHFNNFLKKYYHKTDPATLTKQEASKLIEALKNIVKHQGAPPCDE